MKRLFLVLVLGAAFPFGSTSQPSIAPPDSLRRRLAGAPADTSRVLLLDELGRALLIENPAQAIRYSQEGLGLARRLRYGHGEVLMLLNMGATYFEQEEILTSFRYYKAATQRAAPLPREQRLLTLALLGLGRVAVMQADYAEGQRYFYQARQRMLRREHAVRPSDRVMMDNNLAQFYIEWLGSGQAYPDSAKRLCMQYNLRVVKYLQRRPASASLAICLNSLGQAHYLSQHYDSAAHYHQQALRLFLRFGQRGKATQIQETQVLLGEALVAQHRASEALPFLRAALSGAHRLQLAFLTANCALALANALAETGQGTAAYYLAKRGQALRDSLEHANQNATLARLRVQFETAQERSRVQELTSRNRLQQLEARKQRHYLWWLASFLLAVALGLVVSGALARRLRRQYTELQATRAEQDRLYALIAHDLRSPVMAFSGLADLLNMYVERRDTARLMGLGERVRQAAEGLRELLDNLLNWALAQRGELQPLVEPVPVAPLLAELERLYQPSAAALGIHLTVDHPPDSPLSADRNMTLTILRNLVSNALQATPPGGSVRVQVAEVTATWLRVEVTDTGQGMSPEQLARAISSTALPRATHYRGRAGLGLRLCLFFARAQGAQLTLRSAQGQGTTATLSLARAVVEPAPTPAASARRPTLAP